MDTDPVVLPLSVSFELPVIDLSDKTLKPGSSKWNEVKSDVRKALEDYGCFEATFENVSPELKKSVFEAMEELFELPIQTKQRNVSPKPFHGYICYNLYQSLGVDGANVLEKVNEFTQQIFPKQGDKKSISETIYRFSEQLSEVEKMVKRMIMESFGIEKCIDEHLNSTNYLLRMMKYTPPLDAVDDEQSKLGLPVHTDKNMISILHQYQVDGLEVKTRDEKWIKVKPSQGSFLIMIGDSLCAFLNGRLSSPCHRVMMMGKKTRYSTALFSAPNPGFIIDSPEELIDEEHPRIFKPFAYNEFLHFFNTQAGQRRALSALHDYCAL